MIAEALADIARSLDDVTAILLTHSHGDHTGSAAAIKNASNAAVYASEADAPAIRGDEKPPAPPVKFYAIPFKLLVQALPDPQPTEVDHYVSEHGDVKLPGDQGYRHPGSHTGTCFVCPRASRRRCFRGGRCEDRQRRPGHPRLLQSVNTASGRKPSSSG